MEKPDIIAEVEQLEESILTHEYAIEDLEEQRANVGVTKRPIWIPLLVTLLALMIAGALVLHMGELFGLWDARTLVTGCLSGIDGLAANSKAWGTVPSTIVQVLCWLPKGIVTVVGVFLVGALRQVLELVPATTTYLPFIEGVLALIALIVLVRVWVPSPDARLDADQAKELAVALKERKAQLKKDQSRLKKLERSRAYVATKREWDATADQRLAEEEEERKRLDAQRRAEEELAEAERIMRKREEEERARVESIEMARQRRIDMVQAVKDQYEARTNHGKKADILLLSDNAGKEEAIAAMLREFCPDDREIIESAHMTEANAKVQNGGKVAVVLTGSSDVYARELRRFAQAHIKAPKIMVLMLTSDILSEGGTRPPKGRMIYDADCGFDVMEFLVVELNPLTMARIYLMADELGTELAGNQYFLVDLVSELEFSRLMRSPY